jgi:FMN phosphatase YigB (HAD superfamily)
VDQAIVKQAMQHLFDLSQFTFARIIESLKGKYPAVADKYFLERLKVWFYENLRAYPDSHEYLGLWKQDVPVIILTFGDPEYQREKLRFTQIPYQEVRYASPGKNKVAHLRELIQQYGYPLAFIDDRSDILDQVRAAGLTKKHIITYQMQRLPPREVFTAQYPHALVHNFSEVDSLIRI